MKTVVPTLLLMLLPASVVAPPAFAQTSPSLAVTYRTLNRSESNKYVFKAKYPVFAGTTPVVRLANAAARARAEKMLTDFQKRVKDDAKEFGTEGFHGDYTMSITPVISLARPDLVSFYFTREAYLGGAHGSTDYTAMNFGMRGSAAKPLDLSDVFKAGFTPYGGLDKYLIPALKQKKASLIIDGDIKTLGKEELKSWCVTPTGMTFIFQPYAVASYAEGTFIVTKPFAELKGVLAPQGPLVEML